MSEQRDFAAERKEEIKQVAALENQIFALVENQDAGVAIEALVLAIHRISGFSHFCKLLNR